MFKYLVLTTTGTRFFSSFFASVTGVSEALAADDDDVADAGVEPDSDAVVVSVDEADDDPPPKNPLSLPT